MVCKKNGVINAYVADSGIGGLYMPDGSIKPDLLAQMYWLEPQIASNPDDLFIKSFLDNFRPDGQIIVNVKRGTNKDDKRNIVRYLTPRQSQRQQALAALNKIKGVIQAIKRNNLYNNTLFQTKILTTTIQKSLNDLNAAWPSNIRINLTNANAALQTITKLRKNIAKINNEK